MKRLIGGLATLAVVTAMVVLTTAPAALATAACTVSRVGGGTDGPHYTSTTSVQNGRVFATCATRWFVFPVSLQFKPNGVWSNGPAHTSLLTPGSNCGNGTSGSSNLYACPSGACAQPCGAFFGAGNGAELVGPEWGWSNLYSGSQPSIRNEWDFVNWYTNVGICNLTVYSDDTISTTCTLGN